MIIKVIVEIPKGSRNKYEFDENLNCMKFDRMLFSSMHYPCDYGFIKDTIGDDKDPLDAMVLIWEPTFPGCYIEARPVGLFRMYDEKGQDDKILCVPIGDPMWNNINSIDQVPSHLLIEIEHFFKVYKELEKKKTGVEGWQNRETAIEVIKKAETRYNNRKTK